MHLDPILPTVVGVLVIVLVAGLLIRTLRQPHVVGYLLTGILIGPHGLALIEKHDDVTRLGSIGVVLLLFFIGMEVSPRRLLAAWRIAVIGTVCQIVISVLCVFAIGWYLQWPLARSILLGFVISLSSTAVVLKILKDTNDMESNTGQSVLGILLFQDLAVIPMLIIIGLMGGSEINGQELMLQFIGTVLLVGIFVYIVTREVVHFPLSTWLKQDQEMQTFAALAICFSMSLMSALFHLSTALGAFIAGMYIASARETRWVHANLEPFRVVFVALFFVSVGLLVDLTFISEFWLAILLVVVAVVLTNTLINAAILRALGDDWRDSLYAGSLLSQVGEFSFVLAAVGVQAKMISSHAYQLTIAVIVFSLAFSPFWIAATKRLLNARQSQPS